MVPVINKDNTPLMPCTPRKARIRMEKGQAIPWRHKGIFCIKLTKQVDNAKFQDIVLGIDPGSKREGYTVATRKSVVINITSNTPHWVKKNVETRHTLRRGRRYRNTPYRKCRWNRATLSKTGRVPPSTLARWNAKLRVLKALAKVLPITIINVEDIAARTMKGKNKRRYNASFSPLQVGKNYFYNQIGMLYPSIDLKKTKGYETWLHRKIMRYSKSSKKLDYVWEAHNVDSHSLCELALQTCVKPYKKLWSLKFLQWSRRQLHVQVPIKGGKRREDGKTLSIDGLPRGTVIRNKTNYTMFSLSSSVIVNKVSLHSLKDNDRLFRDKKIAMKDWSVLYFAKWLLNPIHQ